MCAIKYRLNRHVGWFEIQSRFAITNPNFNDPMGPNIFYEWKENQKYYIFETGIMA